ncbi:hypothetical protein RUM44_000719 [Polyplax serrata]|uniref:Telomerase reverse transcriptase n=1 Tax=Polyplax serrata TaxID=468196 RepID=A0ABR1B640_POLSC
MATLFQSLGWRHVETLNEFSSKFPDLPTCLDDDFDKVWIFHKTDFMNFTKSVMCKSDYSDLRTHILKKISSTNNFSELNMMTIFDKIFNHFKGYLSFYIFYYCYLFYNWGRNSFEVLLDRDEIYEKVGKIQQSSTDIKGGPGTLEYKYNIHRSDFTKGVQKTFSAVENEELKKFVRDTGNLKQKKFISLKRLKNAIQGSSSFADISRNQSNLLHETFDLKSVLYDNKIQAKWPSNHIFSVNNLDLLLSFIINLGSKAEIMLEITPENGCKNWVEYKKLLKQFLEGHMKVEKYNGYGRILTRHLKHANKPYKASSNLVTIPLSVVSSYVLDILRKVLPFEFYGSNRLRKKFFSVLVKVINGKLGEKFIWYSLAESFISNNEKLIWCSDIRNHETKNFIILTTLQFVVVHYVFVILKNNFYITETGSSGNGLRYYTKSNMGKVSNQFVNDLLYHQHLRLQKRRDLDLFTIERKWIDTGVIDASDLERNSLQFMNPNSEFKQPIAAVRFLPKNDTAQAMRIITYIRKKPSFLKSDSDVANLSKVFYHRQKKRCKKLYHVKLFLDFLIEKVDFESTQFSKSFKLEQLWWKAICLKKRYGKVYFVKADIADAFDSVVHSKLLQILRETTLKGCGEYQQLLKIIEWRKLKNRFVRNARLSFSRRPKENSILVSRSNFIDNDEKLPKYKVSELVDIIKQVSMEQRLKINSRIFKLVKGVCQGSAGKFSSQLCELYYSSMDNFYFKKFMESDECSLVRCVDDYLLITSQREKAKRFVQIVRSGVKDFNVRFNIEKLKSNLREEVAEVNYLGLVFNFEDMSVRPDYSKYNGRGLLSTMRLSDRMKNMYFRKHDFLERRLQRTNILKLDPLVFKCKYNDLKTIKEVVFQACVLQSSRTMVLANHLYPRGNINDLFVEKILFQSLKQLKKLSSLRNIFTIDELTWIFLQAAVLTFRKRAGQFKTLLLIMRFHLQKFEQNFSFQQKKIYLNNLIDSLCEKTNIKFFLKHAIRK